ncbi:integrase [Labrenzia suaedae]|uniref:Integrase n=1 Tax=Roseibium litorale TaxID=2803841 RepID=A0ABR9CT71_9HYPH|nr:integrase [Roseibium litorale]MBD8894052.1 integrase [Roseibium litorale]
MDRRKKVKQALKTKDEAEALVRAGEIDRRLTAYWASLVKSGSTHAPDRFRAAIDLASIFGFQYQPFSEVIQLPPSDFVNRAVKLAEVGPDSGANFQALFGTAKFPEIRFSDLLTEYERIAKDQIKGKSDDQLRVWRNPRKRAIKNWLSVVSDTSLDKTDQYQALEFKDWWLERLETEDLKSGSANKDLNHLAKMHREVCKFHRITQNDPFRGMLFPSDEEPEKHPFSRPWVQDKLLPGLATLNPEARAIVFVMASTGARPSEIARCAARNLVVDAAIPHIVIEPEPGRKLKTKYSRRVIPLCGSALTGAKMLIELNSRTYSERTSSLSAAVNKYLSEHNLRESPNHSFYGLRHTFQDGLTALDVTDRMQTDLMGHKFDRPVYGKGPTLEHKLSVVKKLAFSLIS